jgi:hypothetical protein
MTRKASDILADLLPPAEGTTAALYRQYVAGCLAGLPWEELTMLCRFFQTDIGGLESHVAGFKTDEAKQAALAARKKGGTHVAAKR